jgi:uncharacterized protein (TIRG00374 family)
MAADAPAPAAASSTPAVQVVDTPLTRVHRTSDLIALLATTVGIALVLVVGAYAEGTTEGITEDIQGISSTLQRLLVAPVNIFSGIVTLVLPGIVVIDLAVRREPRRLLEVLGAAALGFVVALLASFLVVRYGSDELVRSLSVTRGGERVVALPAYIAGVAALLTAAGRRSVSRTLGISWNLLWISLAVGVISGIVTLPAAIVTVLIGRLAGLGFRYALGSTADRAYGDALVDGVRRAGFEPKSLVRADATSAYAPPELDEVSTALGRTRTGRIYALTTVENHHLLVVALDGDRHVAGFIARLWSSIRLRGINARADVSLRHTAEATALVSYAARNAGVRTARVMGMAQSRDTMIIVYQRPSHARPLSSFKPGDINDAMLDAIWEQVEKAHHAGISHRSLSADTVLIGTDDSVDAPTVWLSTWEHGEVATSPLARRIDRAQVATMLAPVVGVERAVDSAFRALGDEDVQGFAPLLQPIVLPRATRTALKGMEGGLGAVRSGIVEHLPESNLEPENIVRFGVRKVLLLLLGLVAVAVVLTSFNTEDVLDALQRANPWWLLVAFGWSLVSFVGAALAMVAFSPVRLPLNRVLLVQVAAAYVALAVPAGIGPAAMNLRLLTKRNVATPLAAATVALVQVSSIVVTVVGLVVLTLATGSEGTLAKLPSRAILIGVGATVVVIAATLILPSVRALVARRFVPMMRQTWPRLSEILGQPWRLVLGLFGNLLLTVAFVGTLHATLEAFGQDLPLVSVAIVLLLGNAVAAAIPTPGGIGTVDFALIAALSGAGVPPGVAPSVAIVYRVIAYWIRIPMGFVAMKYLQRKGEL